MEFDHDHGSAGFGGIVTEVARVVEAGGTILTALTIAPAAAPLTLNRDYRVFQDRTVEDLVEEIVAQTTQPVAFRLHETPETHLMIVQYRESDFDFVSRAMEDAGVFYFFDTDGTMVVTDSNTEFADEGGTIIFGDGVNAKADHGDPATGFRLGSRLTALSATAIGFNFLAPEAAIQATVPAGGGAPELVSFGQSVE